MSKARFPVYRDHRGVTCYSCHELLDMRTAYDSGYPDGRWAQDCRACGLTTFYDIEPARSTAMLDQMRAAQLKDSER